MEEPWMTTRHSNSCSNDTKAFFLLDDWLNQVTTRTHTRIIKIVGFFHTEEPSDSFLTSLMGF